MARATITTTDQVILGSWATEKSGAVFYEQLSAMLRMRTAGASIWLEIDAPATTTDGYEWKVGDPPWSLDLDKGHQLHAILAAGTPDQVIDILKTEQD